MSTEIIVTDPITEFGDRKKIWATGYSRLLQKYLSVTANDTVHLKGTWDSSVCDYVELTIECKDCGVKALDIVEFKNFSFNEEQSEISVKGTCEICDF